MPHPVRCELEQLHPVLRESLDELAPEEVSIHLDVAYPPPVTRLQFDSDSDSVQLPNSLLPPGVSKKWSGRNPRSLSISPALSIWQARL